MVNWKDPQVWLIVARIVFGMIVVALGAWAVLTDRLLFRELAEIFIAFLVGARLVESGISTGQLYGKIRNGHTDTKV